MKCQLYWATKTEGSFRWTEYCISAEPVFSPLLFLFYTYNLRACVPQSLRVTEYTGDVALWSVDRRKKSAATAVETGVGNVAKWSEDNRLKPKTQFVKES